MKTKLTSFDVTKALEKGVGELVGGITDGLDLKSTLSKAGVAISKKGLEAVEGQNEAVAFFREEKADIEELVKKMSPVFLITINGNNEGLFLSRKNKASDWQLILALAKLSMGEKKLIRSLNLTGADLRNSNLMLLKGFENLEELYLDSPEIADGEMESVIELVKLKSLSLMRTAVGDVGARELLALKNLMTLQLSGAGVTDSSYEALAPMPSLRILRLVGTSVTRAGLDAFRLTRKVLNLPEVEIDYG